MAESQGFEPWVPVKAQRFSRPSRSTAPATLHTIRYASKSSILLIQIHHEYYNVVFKFLSLYGLCSVFYQAHKRQNRVNRQDKLSSLRFKELSQ